jgi:hypothetical protein
MREQMTKGTILETRDKVIDKVSSIVADDALC